MNSYMVVATFNEGVSPEDIRALIPAEQAQVKILEAQGVIGAIKVSMAKRTVFIEALGEDDQSVSATINTLPLAALWNFEVFPTTPPAGSSF